MDAVADTVADGVADTGSDTEADTDTGADVGPTPPAVMNPGWIGGPCEADADCAAVDGGVCATAADGFPAGHCTKACASTCPDQAGAVTTFCLDDEVLGLDAGALGEGVGACAMRCRFGLDATETTSPTGCRAGYHCERLTRHGQPDVDVGVCVPGEEGGLTLSPCEADLLGAGVAFELADNPQAHPDGHPDLTCDVDHPVRVEGVLHGVAYRYASLDAPPKTLFAACPLAWALVRTADELAAQGTTDLIHLGIYNCRVISGTAKLSQHGLANALDIAAVTTPDGQLAVVLDDWEKDTPMPTTDKGAYLKWLANTLYDEEIFHIILTPDYNAAHANHFHVDLTPGSHFLK